MGERVGAVLIAGPTASGKSALALEVARDFCGVVINTDSMQVYRDLLVLTARPSASEENLVPHRLYGHVDGALNYSAGRFATDAARVLDEARALTRLPVFVGGTGLYFKSLIEGLSVLPAVPMQIRDRVRTRAEGRPTPDLWAELARSDPKTAAGLRPSDRLRVLRALEIFEATGRSIAAFQGARTPGPLAGARTVRVFLSPDREALRHRIDSRFRAMLDQGALQEVQALAGRGLDPLLPVMRAHGVPGLLRYLRREISLEEAIAQGQGDTRRYAKRQFTWFRHQMPGWTWVAPENARAAIEGAMQSPGSP